MVTMQFGPYLTGFAVVGLLPRSPGLQSYNLVCVWCHNSSFYGITTWRVACKWYVTTIPPATEWDHI